jgi:hypothetical protein
MSMIIKKFILIFIGILIIMAWLLGSVTQAVAETRQFRNVGQFSKMEMIQAADVEGHLLLIWEWRGLQFSDGEVAILSGWGTCDIVKGNGPCEGYYLSKSEDGSTTVSRTKFISTMSPDGKTASYEGTGEYTGGTGRFAGIKGSMSFKGKRITPISPGLKETRGDVVADGTATYTLPPK